MYKRQVQDVRIDPNLDDRAVRPHSQGCALNQPAQTTEPVPMHDARTLTGGQLTAQIVLGEQVYTLRITKAEKLILTK